MNNFPREFSPLEIELLEFLLPEDIKVYADFRKAILGKQVVGSGRFGTSNLLLSNDPEDADYHSGLGKIFTSGVYIKGNVKYDMSLHFEVNGVIEFDIAESEAEASAESFTLSRWKPDNTEQYPFDGLRTVLIEEASYIMVISKRLSLIWLHEYKTGFNRILPKTNLMNEIRFAAGLPGDLSSKEIFVKLAEVSDEIIKIAFLNYNKLFKKIDQQILQKKPAPASVSIFKRFFTGKSK